MARNTNRNLRNRRRLQKIGKKLRQQAKAQRKARSAISKAK